MLLLLLLLSLLVIAELVLLLLGTVPELELVQVPLLMLVDRVNR